MTSDENFEKIGTSLMQQHSVRYDLVLDCYRSGQMSELQWMEHLKDEHFAAWYKKQQRA